MRVRSATRDDFGRVTALLEELGRPQVTEETRAVASATFEDQLADPGSDHLVAEDDAGAVVGFCSLHYLRRLNYASEHAWIPDLIVTTEARRRRVAFGLLEEAERRARARGCWVLTLESGHARVEAHALYEAFAMTHSGRSFAKLLRD